MGEESCGENMSFAKMPGGEIDYAPCRYGKSRIAFRGPKKKLEDPSYIDEKVVETVAERVMDILQP